MPSVVFIVLSGYLTANLILGKLTGKTSIRSSASAASGGSEDRVLISAARSPSTVVRHAHTTAKTREVLDPQHDLALREKLEKPPRLAWPEKIAGLRAAGEHAPDNYCRRGNMVGALAFETGMIKRVVSGFGPTLCEHHRHPATGAQLVGLSIPGWRGSRGGLTDPFIEHLRRCGYKGRLV